MRKILFAIAFLVPALLVGQQTFTGNVIIQKTSPALYLKGSGAFIDFYNGDLVLTQSTNKLTLTGGNLIVPNMGLGYTTTAAANDTTTLTVASTYYQFFTGSTTQRVKLPVTSTLALGHQFYIINNSSGIVKIISSGGNEVVSLAGNTRARVTCITLAGTGAANWSYWYYGTLVASSKVLTISNTLTLAGTDGTTMTFPSSSSTVVVIADTATMLAHYSKTTTVNLKLNISDSATMLNPYAKKVSPVFTGVITIPSGDTTITAAKGKIIFRTADSTFYGCRTTKTTVKKWYALDIQ